jgi:hypothetical protein
LQTDNGLITLTAGNDIFDPATIQTTTADIIATAQNNFNVDTGTSYISDSGNISLTATNNTLTIGSGASFTTNTGDLTFIAGQNITDLGNSTFSALGGKITIVADNNFPTSPGIGTGRITLSDGTQLESLQDVLAGIRLFSARQVLNSINSNVAFNGVPFTPGTPLINTPTEEWFLYFIDNPPTNSPDFFTFFYKGDNTLPTPPTTTAINEGLIIAAQDRKAVAVAELFRCLHPYNEYVSRYLRFYIKEDTTTHKFYLKQRSNTMDSMQEEDSL